MKESTPPRLKILNPAAVDMVQDVGRHHVGEGLPVRPEVEASADGHVPPLQEEKEEKDEEEQKMNHATWTTMRAIC